MVLPCLTWVRAEVSVEYRALGRSGLFVPVMTMGTATFGGGDDFFKAWGTTGREGAKDLVTRCIDAGVTMFDTADSYSNGLAEEILGFALSGRRDQALISSKASEPVGGGVNDRGSSRWHLIRSVDASLRRMQTDWIDVLYVHLEDKSTPVEETLSTLDGLVVSGKVRYAAASNFSAWRLMQSIAIADRRGWQSRYVGHQVAYSLIERNIEHELVPLAADQGVGTVAYSPLGGGALSGKLRADQPLPEDSRLGKLPASVPTPLARVHRIVQALSDVAERSHRTVSQVALNWLIHRPTISSIVFGARNPTQLEENLGAIGWSLAEPDISVLDDASNLPAPYPYSQQAHFAHLRTRDPAF